MLVDRRSRLPLMAAPVQLHAMQLIDAEADWAGMMIGGAGLFCRGISMAAIRATDVVLMWAERARSRRHLARLDDRALGDLGLTRAQVSEETRKPFWG